MSIFVVYVTAAGLVFGADRNITSWKRLWDGKEEWVVSGQSQRPKVLRWPDRELLIGYVGEARVRGDLTDKWLYSFIGRNLDGRPIGDIALRLRDELEAAFPDRPFPGHLVIHLGGFQKADQLWLPEVHFVHNTTGLSDDGFYQVGDHFTSSEELSRDIYLGKVPRDEWRAALKKTPFSFRHGTDLAAFNTIDSKLHEAMDLLIAGHPRKVHPLPENLEEWSKHMVFRIQAYAAYFVAFYPPFQQLVGGRADYLTAEWR